MCNPACIEFVARVVRVDDVRGKDVLEVGSYDTTGSVRPHVVAHAPRSYLGVDLIRGPSVDAVCDVLDLAATYGPAAFDLVISTEMVEHVRDWRSAFSNMKYVLRPGGLLVITTRSVGFPFHFGPFDFWRYEPDDMERIAGDMDIVTVERDPISPGVFLAARRREAGSVGLSDIALHSMIHGRRVATVSNGDVLRYQLTHPMALARRVLPAPIRRPLKRLLGR